MSVKARKVKWSKYNSLKGLNITDGIDPAEYIRKLREKEDKNWSLNKEESK